MLCSEIDRNFSSLCDHEAELFSHSSYAIYHLKKLKVLDGLGIDPMEQQAAKSRYAGRLSIEMIEEKVRQITSHERTNG